MAVSTSVLLAIIGLIGVLGAPVVMSSPKSVDVTRADEMERLVPLPATVAPRKSCTDDTQCDFNHFCFGKGWTKRCIPCFNCADAQRKPKQKTYDDEASICHHHRNDCGDCNDGYEMTAGICTPKKSNVSPYAPNVPKTASSLEFGKAWTWTLAFFIMILVGIASFVVWGVRKGVQWYLKRGGTHYEDFENHVVDGSPSAPPEEEYRVPPPSVPLMPCPDPGPSFPRFEQRRSSLNNQTQKVTFKKQQANPFQLGYMASDMDENDGGTMEVDGSTVPDDENTNDSGPTDDAEPPQGATITIADPRDMSSPNPGGQQSESRLQNQTRLRSNSEPNATAAMTSGPRYVAQEQSRPGALVSPPWSPIMEMGASFWVRFWLDRPINGSASTISAPASPRRIDDTIIVPLDEFQGPFLASNISLDSGTGTNDNDADHDRSMQSRSTSGTDVRRADFSDMDSMYGDGDTYSPASGAVVHDHSVVPEIDVVVQRQHQLQS